MIVQVILVAIAVLVLYVVYRKFAPRGGFKRCDKCEGNGYWIATRGEKTTCNNCGGSGKVK